MRIKIAILLILYAVGAIGINTDFGFVFAALTPINLLISAALIFPRHPDPRFIAISTLIFLLGYAVEALGIHTGFPFGDYRYLDNLGIKLWEVPLLIGLNWWLMVYGSLQVMLWFGIDRGWQVIGAATLMLGFDYILEMQATRLGMWQWELVVPPWQNYAAWWVIGAVLALIGQKKLTETANPMAAFLFVLQWIFFAVLVLTN
jgi:putative membrane protein